MTSIPLGFRVFIGTDEKVNTWGFLETDIIGTDENPELQRNTCHCHYTYGNPADNYNKCIGFEKHNLSDEYFSY